MLSLPERFGSDHPEFLLHRNGLVGGLANRYGNRWYALTDPDGGEMETPSTAACDCSLFVLIFLGLLRMQRAMSEPMNLSALGGSQIPLI